MGDWQERAACSGLPTSMFYEDIWPETEEGDPLPADADALARAKAVCAACPVRLQCYTEAMKDEDSAADARRFGYRGGTTPSQRYSIWRRDSMRCERCGETYDPAGLVDGDAVCGCGAFTEPPIGPDGDTWYPRHDGLLARLVEHLLENTEPGDRIPPPYRMLEALGHRRKDDMPLVYERLIDDGLIEKGPGRGEYYRRAGKQALRSWRPPARRRRSVEPDVEGEPDAEGDPRGE